MEMQEEVIEQECFENLSTLRSVILGGEPIQKSRLTTWLSSGDCHSRVMNSYGPTECSDVVAFHWLENEECVEGEESSGVIPIGRAIENTHLRVLDHNLQPVPVGVVGELYVSGDGVGLGYINKKTLTNNVFIDNPFDSGHLYKTVGWPWGFVVSGFLWRSGSWYTSRTRIHHDALAIRYGRTACRHHRRWQGSCRWGL